MDALRGRPVREVATGSPGLEAPRVSAESFAVAAGAVAGSDIEPGHGIEVLADADLFRRLEDDLSSATTSITMHVYFCEPGLLGNRIADALAERARAGVQVLFLADGFACRRLLEVITPRLAAAGVGVGALRRPRWYALHRIQHRNHSRLVVIDGRVAYTGGFGIADQWIGDGDEPVWRDTAVRFTGPAVSDAQAAFVAAWAEVTGTLIAGEAFFPAGSDAASEDVRDRIFRDVSAGFQYSQPGIGTTSAERAFALSVAAARRTLFISNAYFVPTPLIRRSLLDAARRGVDVRLLLPGPRTDVASTRWAGRSYYGELMDAGVRIFEYQAAMMHAKTLVADGVWSSIGSMNLDNRSMRLNDEAALLVHDARVGGLLDSIFLADLRRAIEVTPRSYGDRPRWHRFLEWATRLVAPLL